MPVFCHVATTQRSMSEWPALASIPLVLSRADTAHLTSQELLLGFTEISTWMLFLIGEGRLCLHGMHWRELIVDMLPVTQPT